MSAVVVRRFDQFDASEALAKPERLGNGSIKVEGKISRTGIQLYYERDGKARRELRLPEEVFDEAAVNSFRNLSMTNTHPPEMIVPRNARRYTVGWTGDNVRKLDEKWLGATMVILDEDAIADVEDGRSQLSCGYSCELDMAQVPSLTAQWGKYDAIQRKIRGNHVAVVDAARAGPEASIKMDAGDASMIVSNPLLQPESMKMAHTLRVDGFAFEVTDANTQAAVDKAIANARAAGESIAAQVQAKLDVETKARIDSTTALSALQAKYDGEKAAETARLDAKVTCDECGGTGMVDTAKCDGCDGAKSIATKADTAERRAAVGERKLARAVKARVALEVEARKHLGTDAKLDGKTELDVKRLVIAKLVPDAKLDGKDAVYIAVRYDDCIERLAKVTNADRARSGAFGTAPTPVLAVVKDGDDGEHLDMMTADPVQVRAAALARSRKLAAEGRK